MYDSVYLLCRNIVLWAPKKLERDNFELTLELGAFWWRRWTLWRWSLAALVSLTSPNQLEGVKTDDFVSLRQRNQKNVTEESERREDEEKLCVCKAETRRTHFSFVKKWIGRAAFDTQLLSELNLKRCHDKSWSFVPTGLSRRHNETKNTKDSQKIISTSISAVVCVANTRHCWTSHRMHVSLCCSNFTISICNNRANYINKHFSRTVVCCQSANIHNIDLSQYLRMRCTWKGRAQQTVQYFCILSILLSVFTVVFTDLSLLFEHFLSAGSRAMVRIETRKWRKMR